MITLKIKKTSDTDRAGRKEYMKIYYCERKNC